MALLRLILVALLAVGPVLTGGVADAHAGTAWTMHAGSVAHETAERSPAKTASEPCCSDRVERSGGSCHLDITFLPSCMSGAGRTIGGCSFSNPIGIPEGVGTGALPEPPRAA